MRWSYGCVSALILISAMAFSVRASVEWSYNGGTPTALPVSTLSVSGTGNVLRIYSTTGSDAIPAVTLSGSASTGSSLCIIVASTSTSCGGATTFSGGASFAGLSFQTGSEALRDASALTLNVTGNITGDITVGRITRIMPGGNIITGTTTTATADDDGSTRAITLIQPDGSVLGSIIATNGSIGELRSTAGNIGPTTGNTRPTVHGHHIGTIQANNINADIVATGTLARLNATDGSVNGSVSVAGKFALDPFGEADPELSLIDATEESTARIEAGSIVGSIHVNGMHNENGTAGIICSDFFGNITSTGRIDVLQFSSFNCDSSGRWHRDRATEIGSVISVFPRSPDPTLSPR